MSRHSSSLSMGRPQIQGKICLPCHPFPLDKFHDTDSKGRPAGISTCGVCVPCGGVTHPHGKQDKVTTGFNACFRKAHASSATAWPKPSNPPCTPGKSKRDWLAYGRRPGHRSFGSPEQAPAASLQRGLAPHHKTPAPRSTHIRPPPSMPSKLWQEHPAVTKARTGHLPAESQGMCS